MKILIVEDNMILSGMIEKWLQKAGYEVLTAIDEPGARSILKKNEINLVLGDVRLPEGDGISLLEWMMRSKMEVPFIVMTDYACIKDAVRAIKLGAKDYLQKPVHQELLIELVHSMLKQPVIVRKERSFVERTSEAARKAASLARRVAPSDLSVMILGPSGSGKEVIAQMIHRYSDRRDKPFVAVNCGSIPNDLQASEFFGAVKGAFTGAVADRKGHFETANGGTLFLDEVGNMPYSMQILLLRVLQEKEFNPVGSDKVKHIDVRIVSATNEDMEKAVQEGRFREDLYYRLNTVPIKIPPLRERGDDITLLFRKFASDFAEKYRMPAIQLTEDAKVLLLAYSWPGNVRQLKNITEQISIIETNRDITAEILRNYLPEQHVNSGLPALFGVKANTGKAFESEREILYQVLFDMRRDVTDLKKLVNTLMAERGAQSVPTAPATTAVSYYQEPQRNLVATVVPATPTIISAAKPAHPVVDDIQDTEEVVEEATLSLDEVEKEMIRKALDRHHGKRKNAAKDLNISERTLYRKIKEYGLD